MIYLTEVPEGLAGQNQKKLLHRTAWALLGLVLREEYPHVVLGDSLRFGPHGKPFLDGGPHFSLSHTKGLAVCTVEVGNTGVDAEKKRAFPLRLQERVFTPQERESARLSPDPDSFFTTLWTLKESYMKYTGLGLAQGADTLPFHFENGVPVLDGAGVYFRTAVWQGYAIAQCRALPFELSIYPVGFDRLGLDGQS